jgi:hypothetical protein
MRQRILRAGQEQSQTPQRRPVSALHNCFDRRGTLRAHQPLKLSNNLTLRNFLSKYEARNSYCND